MTKSNELNSDLFRGQASVPYSRIGKHLLVTIWSIYIASFSWARAQDASYGPFQYNRRKQSHSLQLPAKTSSLSGNGFINIMLHKNIACRQSNSNAQQTLNTILAHSH